MTVSIDAPSPANLESLKNDPKTYTLLESSLLNTSGQTPLFERFRSLFALKGLGTIKAIDIIAKGFLDDSALLKHELAYVLGQMKDQYAIPHLVVVLEDSAQETMVRHEAAEALGAISCPSVLPLLKKYLSDPSQAVRETCELSIAKINYDIVQSATASSDPTASKYLSVDPAPSLAMDREWSVEELKTVLLDQSKSLFERYRAMFALRNRGDEEAVLALAHGFTDPSCLFRHEIAYVFGQLQHPSSVPSLTLILQNPLEEGMVRHEAAEALGSIGTDECWPVLNQFRMDAEQVVRESCEVGLDMWEFENSGAFQYANSLQKTT